MEDATKKDAALTELPLKILVRKMEEAKARNPMLSNRGFAQRLGLSSGAFSEVLQGKRSLSHQIKLKIAPRLHLSPKEEIDFFQNDLPSNLRPKSDEHVKLTTDQFHLISDWWHYGLLNLLNTRGFKATPVWMAKRLGLPKQVVSDAWDRLLRLGHVVKGAGGKFTRKHPKLTTTDELFDLSLRKSHLGDLKLMEESLMEVPLHLRDHTAMMMVIDKKNIPKAKELIRIFQDHFCQQVETEPGEEVYRLSIAFYPISQVVEEQ